MHELLAIAKHAGQFSSAAVLAILMPCRTPPPPVKRVPPKLTCQHSRQLAIQLGGCHLGQRQHHCGCPSGAEQRQHDLGWSNNGKGKR